MSKTDAAAQSREGILPLDDVVIYRCIGGRGAFAIKLYDDIWDVEDKRKEITKEYQEHNGGCFCILLQPNGDLKSQKVQEILDAKDMGPRLMPYDDENTCVIVYDEQTKSAVADHADWMETIAARLAEYCAEKRYVDVELIFHSDFFFHGKKSKTIDGALVRKMANAITKGVESSEILLAANIKLGGCNSFEIAKMFHDALVKKSPAEEVPAKHINFHTAAAQGLIYLEMYDLRVTKEEFALLESDPEIQELEEEDYILLDCLTKDSPARVVIEKMLDPTTKYPKKDGQIVPLIRDYEVVISAKKSSSMSAAIHFEPISFNGGMRPFFSTLRKKRCLMPEECKLPDQSIGSRIDGRNIGAYEKEFVARGREYEVGRRLEGTSSEDRSSSPALSTSVIGSGRLSPKLTETEIGP